MSSQSPDFFTETAHSKTGGSMHCTQFAIVCVTSFFRMGCPYCHTANSWKTCPRCGTTYCNSCGRDANGSRPRAANVCGSCGATVSFQYSQHAPAWGR
ncbi:hypothetical protein GPJ56_005547 [Histomonas meleagridis]|uniref:uncharacterized protein n=1 Tax=Histomonas meleagridis TaxID=135588 RepID=UPI0035599885|nr:hypothetical protein GPJ56_005547 [Histomonas meleagridis]KAH0799599.1 hypothetical protein GO595_007667 [Histomonas meleagridis]